MKNILNKIEIHYSTWLLILLSLFAGYVKYVFLILIIVLVHELGHIVSFKIFKINIIKVIIYPFGGITYVNKRIHERIYKEVIWALSGVLFQIILLGVYQFLFKNNFIMNSTYEIFNIYNKSILFFNLLPIVPLDGSKVINSLLNKFLSFYMSYFWTIVIGFIILVLFIGISLIYKVNNIMIYMFLFFSLFKFIKDYKYVMNKFYLERVLYKHYYNKIINNCIDLKEMKLEKYYYFKVGNRYFNESDYIKRKVY